MADFCMSQVFWSTGAGSSNHEETSPLPGKSDTPPMSVKLEDMDKALDWWLKKAVETDAAEARLEAEGRR